jgi:hypothetical protein
MPEDQFERLQKLIAQLGLEWQEAMQRIEGKVDTMQRSLKKCQSRCHVQNDSQKVAP